MLGISSSKQQLKDKTKEVQGGVQEEEGGGEGREGRRRLGYTEAIGEGVVVELNATLSPSPLLLWGVEGLLRLIKGKFSRRILRIYSWCYFVYLSPFSFSFSPSLFLSFSLSLLLSFSPSLLLSFSPSLLLSFFSLPSLTPICSLMPSEGH